MTTTYVETAERSPTFGERVAPAWAWRMVAVLLIATAVFGLAVLVGGGAGGSPDAVEDFSTITD